MHSGCRLIGSRGWAGWMAEKEIRVGEGWKGKKGKKGQGNIGWHGEGKWWTKMRWSKRQRKTANPQLMQCYRCRFRPHLGMLSRFLFPSSFILFRTTRLLLFPAALVSESYIRWGYRCDEQIPHLPPPRLSPQLAQATLIQWCRCTATGRPGEPLVSSLQFQNVLLSVLLFFTLVFPPPPPLLKMPFSCSTSCCAFFSLLLMLLTHLFHIFYGAAWLIPSEGLARHLTQSVSKTKDEEQLTLHTYSVLLPLCLLMERRWINACWEILYRNV